MHVLNQIRQSLIEKQTSLERNKKKLKQSLESKRAELEKCMKEYYVAELDAVLQQDRKENPHRYTRVNR